MVSRAADMAAQMGSQTTNNQVGTQVGTQTTTGSSNTSSNTSSSSSGTQTVKADYLDSGSRAALNSLISGLTNAGGGKSNGLGALTGGSGAKGGGTNAIAEALKKQDQLRLQEIATNQGIRGDYSKANAFADAQGASAAALSDAIQQAMPTITAGIDAAGTSGSALSALLTQQAAEEGAKDAAALSLNAAISYGQIQANLSSAITGLLGQGSSAANALLEALGIAKGASVNSTTTNQQNSSSTTNQSTDSTSTTNTNQTSTQSGTSQTNPLVPTTKKAESGYGLLGDPVVNGANTPTKSSGQSYSQFSS